jgi:hypothetical protein
VNVCHVCLLTAEALFEKGSNIIMILTCSAVASVRGSSLSAVDAQDSNDYWLTSSSFLQVQCCVLAIDDPHPVHVIASVSSRLILTGGTCASVFLPSHCDNHFLTLRCVTCI